MHLFPKPRILTSILAALVLPLALGCAAATADPVRVRGSVVSLDGAKPRRALQRRQGRSHLP